FLVLRPGALPDRRDTPRSHRVVALRLALAAAVRVVYGVHRGAADGWPLPEPAAPAGLPTGLVGVVGVADLTDRGATGEQDAAHLAGGQTQDCVGRVLGHELDARACGARELGSLAGPQLDGMDVRARRDVAERQRVARPDVHAGARLDRRADPQPRGREDVRLRAVRVVEQRDPGRAVRVVLDR